MLSKIKTILTKPLIVVAITASALIASLIVHEMNTLSKVDKIKGSDLAAHSVTVAGARGGGSGVIFLSDDRGSLVLTNNHVCELLADGNGRVITHEQKTVYPVGYRMSLVHDACIIIIKENLGINTAISKLGPDKMDETFAVGHPKLLPTTVSRGHYAGQTRIQIMTGLQECTEDDMKDPDVAFLCMFLGGMPVLTTYTADIHTFLISGGSSGSPVFNSKNEIIGLVFAGSGQMSEAYVVPIEFVLRTLGKPELTVLGTMKTSKTFIEAIKARKSNTPMINAIKKLKRECLKTEINEKIPSLCKLANQSTIFVNEAD